MQSIDSVSTLAIETAMQARTLRFAARQRLDAGVLAVCVTAAAYTLAAIASRTLGAEATSLLKALIVAPVLEEFLFRGIVQAHLRTLRGFQGRPWIVIAVTAFAFGAIHLVSSSPLHAALVVLPAIVIGWAYERTSSITLCIALHSAANAAWIGFWSI